MSRFAIVLAEQPYRLVFAELVGVNAPLSSDWYAPRGIAA
jgi:hypothetical protein